MTSIHFDNQPRFSMKFMGISLRPPVKIIEWIQEGSTATIHRMTAIKESGKVGEYALKLFDISRYLEIQKKESEMLRMINFADPLDEQPIIRTYGEWIYSPTQTGIIETLCVGDLTDFLSEGQVSFQELRIIGRDILKGCAFLDSLPHPIIHLDLKLENILIDQSSRIRITDFGLAQYSPMPSSHSVFGTLYTIAPEVLFQFECTTRADLWSVGAILFVLKTNTYLFDARNIKESMIKIGSCADQIPSFLLEHSSAKKSLFIPHPTVENSMCLAEPRPYRLEDVFQSFLETVDEEDSECAVKFIDFLSHLLKINPNERASVHDLLHHPFLE